MFPIELPNSPLQIWSALDNMDYTGAVEFFLLGRHISVKMQLTGETMAAHVNARVLVKRQWAALDYVETTIASACRKQLALPTASDEVRCFTLCPVPSMFYNGA